MMNSSVNIDVVQLRDPNTERFRGTSESFEFVSARGCPDVRNTVIATTTVESLSDSSSLKWEIAGILSHHGVQKGQQVTPTYLVSGDKAASGLPWISMRSGPSLLQLRDVSIPNNFRELCDRCFEGCESLRRVTFGSSSSLERIGAECFNGSGVEEVRFVNCVIVASVGARVFVA